MPSYVSSGGQTLPVLGDPGQFSLNTLHYGSAGLQLQGVRADYAEIYQTQVWVYILINKLAMATARLPMKVYQRGVQGRLDVPDHPMAQLLMRPNNRHDSYWLWNWTVTTLNIFGEAAWYKVRDKNGQVNELLPLHPNLYVVRNLTPAKVEFQILQRPGVAFAQEDVVHFRYHNPGLGQLERGMSPLDPLRQTISNEDSARRASAAFWSNGARPSFILKHPGQMKQDAASRIRADWERLHKGSDSFGRTAVLEEGMDAQQLTMSAEDAQYIDTRKINREEVCAAFDVPPPVVHILERATFSNITEQMRSMYRDTMAPKLKMLETTVDSQLRPDFGDDVYGEFLMDEVLRGDFEQRVAAYQSSINAGWMEPAEVREKENLEPVEGSQRLFINQAMIAIGGEDVVPVDPLNPVVVPLPGVPEVVPAEAVRSIMGKLSRLTSVYEILTDDITEGLNGSAPLVIREIEAAKLRNLSITELKDNIRALAGG